MNKLLLLGIATLALLANAVTSFAQVCSPSVSGWTSPASAGATIGANALTKYSIGSPFPSCLTFKPTATGTIIAHYDVVNTSVPSTQTPGWNTFEMGYDMPTGTTVMATLYQVTPCTGQVTPICVINGVAGDTCDCCFFNSGLNFFSFLYMVQVTLTRPNTNDQVPSVCTLRIYNSD